MALSAPSRGIMLVTITGLLTGGTITTVLVRAFFWLRAPAQKREAE